MSVSETLREALRQAPSVRAVGRATGLKQPHLSAFLNGRKGLSLESVDVLADHLDLVLVSRPKSRRTKR